MHAEEYQRQHIPTYYSLKGSIVICCYSLDRISDIYQAIQSALNQDYSFCELVVAVDNNPELFKRLMVEHPKKVRLVLNSKVKGLSATRNIGISSSSGDIIAFMDDDSVAKEDWLNKLINDYEDPSVMAVGGKTLPLWELRRPSWFPEELDWIVGGTHKGMPETKEQVRNLWGGNMSFRKEVFEQIGLFRNDLGRTGKSGEGEDTEFCMRLRQNQPNAKIIYEPNAIVYHKVPKQRSRLRYVIKRSFDGGVALAMIRKSQLHGAQTSFSAERNYLRYLLTTSLRCRIKFIYKPHIIAQIGTLFAAVITRGTGYIVGYVAKSSTSRS